MKVGALALTLTVVAAAFVLAGQLLVSHPVEISAIWPEPGRLNLTTDVDKQPNGETLDLSQISFSETVTRPLFSRSRRKFVPPAKPKPVALRPAPKLRAAPKPPPKPATPPPKISLIGVSLRKGEASALLAQGGGENVWVSEGDVIAAWTVKQIGSNSIVLTHDSREVSLRLYKDRN